MSARGYGGRYVARQIRDFGRRRGKADGLSASLKNAIEKERVEKRFLNCLVYSASIGKRLPASYAAVVLMKIDQKTMLAD